MKTKINDLLLKMQTGENCIGETADALLELYENYEKIKAKKNSMIEMLNFAIDKVKKADDLKDISIEQNTKRVTSSPFVTRYEKSIIFYWNDYEKNKEQEQ